MRIGYIEGDIIDLIAVVIFIIFSGEVVNGGTYTFIKSSTNI